ncbi:winged helix-turn-helix domain-containing protein [Aliikangiella sp. IMCC44653]
MTNTAKQIIHSADLVFNFASAEVSRLTARAPSVCLQQAELNQAEQSQTGDGAQQLAQSLRIRPLNMQVLALLLDNAGEVVTRSEIFDKVWKQQIVSDDSLTRCISDLRNQLKQLSPHPLIETIPKKGYRWTAEVQTIDERPEYIGVQTVESNITGKRLIRAQRASEAMETAAPIDTTHKTAHNSNHKSRLLFGFSAVLAVVMLGLLSLLMRYSMQPRYVRVAMLDVVVEQVQLNPIANELDSLLRQKVLITDNIRFLSSSLLRQTTSEILEIYASKYAINYLFESKIQLVANGARVTLDLIEVQSGLVLASETDIVALDSPDLNKIVNRFINKLETTI